MPERRKSKLLATAESDWPDVGHKYGKLGIPAVRAAVMAKNDAAPRQSPAAEDRVRPAKAQRPSREGRR